MLEWAGFVAMVNAVPKVKAVAKARQKLMRDLEG